MAEAPRRYGIDASVVTKWHLRDETYVPESLAVLQDFRNRRIELVAPRLLASEVGSAILKAVRRRRLNLARALASIEEFPAWRIRLVDQFLLSECLSMSHRIGCSFYDGMYLAVAEDLGVPLIHAGAKLHHAIAGRLSFELWIEEYQSRIR